MKLILIALLFMTIHADAGWFGPSEEEKQRIQQTEQQLAQERQSKSNWQIAAGLLAVGAITLLCVGTALGSRIRRHGNE